MFLRELGAEDGKFGEEEFTLDGRSLSVVEHSPDGNNVFKLTTGLFDNAVLPSKDDTHSGQVVDFGLAHDKGVCDEYAVSLAK